MTKHTLRTIFAGFLTLAATACGDAGGAPFVPGPGGTGGDPIVVGGAGGDPTDALVAPFDNDSAAAPAVDEFLSITGTREIVYTDQISAEAGDTEDFVQFELPNNSNPNQRIDVAIDCDVIGDEEVFARVELLNVDGGETTVATGGPIDCNEDFAQMTVRNDQVQLARIHFALTPEEQTLIEYTLIVEAF